MSLTGSVVQVEAARRGAVVVSWVDTVMTVQNAADLPHDGGAVVDESGREWSYLAVVDGPGDDDPDTVMMADSAPDDWTSTWTDDDGNEVVDEQAVYVTPELLDVTATVDCGAGQIIPCVVPQQLRPLLPVGIRDEEGQESVTVDRVATGWTVTDVPGKRAVIEGTKVVVPGRGVTPRVELDGDSLTVLRDDGEGGEAVTTVLGGNEDQLQITRPDRGQVGGIDPDGVITGSSVQVPEVLIDGESMVDKIDAGPQGYKAIHQFTEDTPQVGTAESVVIDLQFTAYPNRLYRFTFASGLRLLSSGRVILRWRTEVGEPGADSAPQPTTASPVAATATYAKVPTDSTETKPLFALWPRPENTHVTAPTPVRAGLGMYTESTSAKTYAARRTGYIAVEDVGSAYTGDMRDGNMGAAAVSTMTRYFTPSWITVWRNGSSQPGVQTPQQGNATRALGVGHPAGMWYSMIAFPQAMRDFMAGAQTISDVSLWTNCYDCMNANGFIPRLSWHSNATNPTTPTGTGDFNLRNLPRGATRWSKLPTDHYSRIASGNVQGLTFGLRVGQSAQFAGCFSILDGAPGAFRVTLTK